MAENKVFLYALLLLFSHIIYSLLPHPKIEEMSRICRQQRAKETQDMTSKRLKSSLSILAEQCPYINYLKYGDLPVHISILSVTVPGLLGPRDYWAQETTGPIAETTGPRRLLGPMIFLEPLNKTKTKLNSVHLVYNFYNKESFKSLTNFVKYIFYQRTMLT